MQLIYQPKYLIAKMKHKERQHFDKDIFAYKWHFCPPFDLIHVKVALCKLVLIFFAFVSKKFAVHKV